MVSSISFGTLNTVGGKTVLTGSQSGIDTNALVTALTTAKALPATQKQTQITANQAKITAYTSLKTALQTLQTSLDTLRNPTFGSSTTNAFGGRSPFLSVTNGKTVSNYLGVATTNGAPIGNYSLQVDQLATAETDQSTSFSDRTSSVVNASGSNTSGQFAAGTFQINGVNITLNQGSSLNNVASAINAQSTNSNVTASIIQISPTDFRLQLTSKKTGSDNAIVITDTSHVLPYTTNLDTTTTQNMFSVTQAAQNSRIKFGTNVNNMQTITRSTNTISDLLDNTTISLYGATNGETVSLAIDKNNSSIATAVGNFVDAYNAVRTFQAQQSQRDQTTGAFIKTAVLGNDTTLNTVMQQLAGLISGQASIAIPSVYSSGSTIAPVRMGDLGISLDNVNAGTDSSGNATPAVTNTLTLDPAKLNSALESYFDNAANIFQFNFTSSTSALGIYKRDNNVTNANFKIAVDTSQPVGSQAKIANIDGSDLSSSISLNYKTTTSKQSLGFHDPDTTSAVGASGSNTAGQFAAGTFQLNGTNVTIAQNDTLNDIVTKINTANTGVTATVVKNATNDYRLVLSGTNDGTNGVVITDTNGVLPTAGMFSTTSSNSVISGKNGTDLASLNLSYTGNGNETISKSSPLTTKDFTVNIDTSQPTGSQAKITKIFGATLVTPISMTYTNSGSSSTIIGPAGTPFAGLQMVYTGNGTDTVDVGMSQGIADKMYNAVNGMLNGITASGSSSTSSTGIIDAAIQSLTDQDTKLQDSITTINDQVATYRTQLVTKFSQLEASISAANQLLALLSAQSNASLVNSGH